MSEDLAVALGNCFAMSPLSSSGRADRVFVARHGPAPTSLSLASGWDRAFDSSASEQIETGELVGAPKRHQRTALPRELTPLND